MGNKLWLAFGLGILSFIVLMIVGEGAGFVAALITLALYYIVCQFFLSRGNADAWRKDWRIMLTLDAAMFFTVAIMAWAEKPEVLLSQGSGILISVCGGTFAGAAIASLFARRKPAGP
jgi:hypothetical protein